MKKTVNVIEQIGILVPETICGGAALAAAGVEWALRAGANVAGRSRIYCENGEAYFTRIRTELDLELAELEKTCNKRRGKKAKATA